MHTQYLKKAWNSKPWSQCCHHLGTIKLNYFDTHRYNFGDVLKAPEHLMRNQPQRQEGDGANETPPPSPPPPPQSPLSSHGDRQRGELGGCRSQAGPSPSLSSPLSTPPSQTNAPPHTSLSPARTLINIPPQITH